jgi:hypothetical protein
MGSGSLDRWGSGDRTCLSAVTLAIGTLIVLLVTGGLSQLSERSSDCDAWTDQCAEPLDDVGDHPFGP